LKYEWLHSPALQPALCGGKVSADYADFRGFPGR
jgi:hypothetical protein